MRKHPYGCLINYYGGKSKIAPKYPAPKYETVVEPFAGGASYSLLHCEKSVILNEWNDRTVVIWKAMLSLSLDEILKHIPDFAMAGDRISDFLTPETPVGVEQFMRACANKGAFGDKTIYDTITPFAADSWNGLIYDKLKYWHPRIQHWKVIHGNYLDLPNIEATWFIDPPYSGGAPGLKGSDYQHNKINYEELAEWCKSRKGQIIVCEHVGANWLPFELLTNLTVTGINGAKLTKEAMWYRD